MSALNPKYYVKAVYAALVSASAAFAAAIVPDRDGTVSVTGIEMILMGFAFLIAFVGTYGVTNEHEPLEEIESPDA